MASRWPAQANARAGMRVMAMFVTNGSAPAAHELRTDSAAAAASPART